MVHIIGASSLDNACKRIRSQSWRQSLYYNPAKITHIPGLSFCHKKKTKNLSFLLSRGSLKNKKDIILWHDTINNTINPHGSNNFNEWTTEQLVEELEGYRRNISAVVYCHRTERSDKADITEALRATGIVLIEVHRHLLSHRKKNNTWYRNQITKIHPDVGIETQLVKTVLRHQSKVKSLVRKKRSKNRKRRSKKRSTSARRRCKKLKVLKTID